MAASPSALPTLTQVAPALICVEELLLFPEFRRRGLGLELMQRVVAALADLRVGAVILKSDPLQFTDEEHWEPHDERAVVGLPRVDRKRSLEELQHHFRTWGMQLLPKTSYMVADQTRLNVEQAHFWAPRWALPLCLARIDQLEFTNGRLRWIKKMFDYGLQ